MRKAVNWLVLILIVYVSSELLFFLTVLTFKKIRPSISSPLRTASISNRHRKLLNELVVKGGGYVRYSPTLGWTINENGRSDLARANSEGIRSGREYRLVPEENILRIASFGDSYTHCDEVGNKDTWQEYLMTADDELEVMNFGVPGYGMDQAFLRYQKDGVQYRPHIVFIGFLPENIFRHVNTFRPFYVPETGLPFAKPRFAMENDRLVLIPNPMQDASQYLDLLDDPKDVLPRLGTYDYYFHSPAYPKEGPFDFLPSVRLFKIWELISMKLTGNFGDIIVDNYFNTESEAFKITVKLFDEFVMRSLKNDSLPVILLFVDRRQVVRYKKDRSKVYEALLNHFDNMGYAYIDLAGAFDVNGDKYDIDDLFLVGHHSPLGNKLTAQYILGYLEQQHLTSLSSVQSRLGEMKERIPPVPSPALRRENPPAKSLSRISGRDSSVAFVRN